MMEHRLAISTQPASGGYLEEKAHVQWRMLMRKMPGTAKISSERTYGRRLPTGFRFCRRL